MTKTAKNTNKIVIENSVEMLKIGNCSMRFAESNTFPGAIGAVIVTPDGWDTETGLVFDSGSVYNSTSGMNAIRDFVAGSYEKVGEFVHMVSQKSSRYDGVRSFYVGGNLILAAIMDGHRAMNLDVDGKRITIALPSADEKFGSFLVHEVFGEWATVKMQTDFFGRAVPANDTKHRNNLVMKHHFLNKLLNGTKLIVNTNPAVKDSGEIWMIGSNGAKLLREELFGADGTAKPVEEAIAPYNERKVLYAGNAKLDRQTVQMTKIAPIVGIKILDSIAIEGNDELIDVTEVPEGYYQLVDQIGNIQNYSFFNNGSLKAQNNLRTGATNGWKLRPVTR